MKFRTKCAISIGAMRLPIIAVGALCLLANSANGQTTSDEFGPPASVTKKHTKPASPPEHCVTFQDWGVGGNAIPEQVYINKEGDRVLLQYSTSDEHLVYQFSAGVRVRVGERYRLTGAIRAGDSSDTPFSVSFSDAVELKTGGKFERRLRPGSSLALSEEIKAQHEHLNLYIHTKPTSPRKVHVFVSNIRLCHIKK